MALCASLLGLKSNGKWAFGWAGSVAAVMLIMVGLHHRTLELGMWKVPKREKYFEPSLARTATGNFIPADTLMMDAYCQYYEDTTIGFTAPIISVPSTTSPICSPSRS